MTTLEAPWTAEQVDALNRYQTSGRMHPFTCGKRDQHRDNEGILVATAQGWICPADDCDYRQGWAHLFMTLPMEESAAEEFLMKLRAERQAGREAVAALAFASEFRIPCPQPDPHGHSDLIAQRRPDDLIIRRRTDGQGDGWLILNPNLPAGDHVWTGSEWVYRGELHRDVIYKWTRDEALELAPELAAAETARFEAWVAQMRAKRGQQ